LIWQEDIFAQYHNVPSQFEVTIRFGFVSKIIKITFEDVDYLLLAIRRIQVETHKTLPDDPEFGVFYSIDGEVPAGIEIVDTKCVIGLIGRGKGAGKTWVVDRGEPIVEPVFND
jgi:hypothetical protein